MIGNYLTNITPDSFSGLIFGFEGIQNTVVILNGPTGCKFYHSAISDDQGQRQREFDPLNYPDEYYFGQPRVPCTYLDKRDYIYGSRAKLEELLHFLQKNLEFELLAVVNSPGAALIGDNLEQIVSGVLGDKPYVIVETPGYSRFVWNGYSAACETMIRRFARRQEGAAAGKSVNLLGLSIYHKYFQGDLLELKKLLSLCGIRVNCALCCQCTPEEIRCLPQANLNLVLYPEYGLSSAKLLEEQFGMPYYTQLPVGFSATEEWLREICRRLDCDPSAALERCERGRARAYIHISRVNSLTGLPKGVKFAVHGTASQCLAYSKVLLNYLAMDAACITVLDGPEEASAEKEKLAQLLRRFGMEEALERDILQTDAALVLADANILAKLKLRQRPFTGIEIALPSFGYVDVIPKTHMGVQGSLLLVEQVLNGLLF